MRTSSASWVWPLPWLFLSGVLGGACRDEQAGPRPKGNVFPAATQAQVLEVPPTDLTYRSQATLAGGTVRYHGSRVSPQNARPGDALTVTHYFEATRPPPDGWAFFVHLVEADTGRMLGNLDHEFQGGALPLARWPVGKVVADEQMLRMPAVSSQILMGFWKEDERLSVDQASAHDGNSRLRGPTLGATATLPEYVVARTTQPPTIDGRLGDAAWQRASRVVLKGSYDGRDVALRTEARLLWSDTFLYVAFEIEDPDVWGTYRQRDQPIYEQEVVEIFIDANADGQTYNEMQVSPHNVQFDAYFPARREGMDLSWDSGMKTAVQVRGTLDDASDRDEGWSAEMQIPLARLAQVPNLPPKPGDRWRFNLYRLEIVGRQGGQQGHAFSPLFIGDFHALPRFGWLVFGKD